MTKRTLLFLRASHPRVPVSSALFSNLCLGAQYRPPLRRLASLWWLSIKTRQLLPSTLLDFFFLPLIFLSPSLIPSSFLSYFLCFLCLILSSFVTPFLLFFLSSSLFILELLVFVYFLSLVLVILLLHVFSLFSFLFLFCFCRFRTIYLVSPPSLTVI